MREVARELIEPPPRSSGVAAPLVVNCHRHDNTAVFRYITSPVQAVLGLNPAPITAGFGISVGTAHPYVTPARRATGPTTTAAIIRPNNAATD